MFGPNSTPPPVEARTHDHRSPAALELRREVLARLTELFDLHDYELLLIPGPATLAMEAVISTVGGEVAVYGNGKFAARWRSMRLGGWDCGTSHSGWKVFCLLETSRSEVHLDVAPLRRGKIVDAVSGWPYYPLPSNTSIFVTTANKLLGASPGLAIVGVHKSAWRLLPPASPRFSYLDLHRHRGHDFLTTASMPVLEQLRTNLRPEYFQAQREQIADVCEQLAAVIPEKCYVGERVCPVLTFERAEFDRCFPDVAAAFQFYPASRPDTDRYHVFTYSEVRACYRRLADAMKNQRAGVYNSQN